VKDERLVKTVMVEMVEGDDLMKDQQKTAINFAL